MSPKNILNKVSKMKIFKLLSPLILYSLTANHLMAMKRGYSASSDNIGIKIDHDNERSNYDCGNESDREDEYEKINDYGKNPTPRKNSSLSLPSPHGKKRVNTTPIKQKSSPIIKEARDYVGNQNQEQIVKELSNAAKTNNSELVRFLILGSADSVKDKNGDTALLGAVRNNNEGIIKILLDVGANANIPDENGNTALMIASARGYKEIAKLLLAAGADFNIQNKIGETALILAAKYDQKEIARILITAGADLNLQNEDGCSALTFASILYDKEIEELLLAKGASITNNWCILI